MKIEQNKFVSLAYTLTVDGAVVDKADATKPLEFIYGTGMLLPKFEEAIAEKVVGDKVSFTLQPADGYGEVVAEYIVELPKNLFEVEGKIDEKVVAVGNILPMMDNEGNRMNGLVKAISEITVTMDFNHPMSGKVLNFDVEVVGVREATEADTMGGGCGCGDCGCEEGGNCEDGGCGSKGCGCE
ncbi:MAG: FKBP-type peptidyl-prolyl cis-trans isomerase [Rikenellaceae bacterium]